MRFSPNLCHPLKIFAGLAKLFHVSFRYRKHHGRVGIADIPDFSTRRPSGIGLEVDKKNTGPPDSRTRGPAAPTVLVTNNSILMSRMKSVLG